jgi:lipoic acid synthetase/lipoate-protein ligase A
VLTAADIAAIEDIEKEYYTQEFIYGNNPAYSIVKNGRIEGVGEFRVSIDAKDGVVRKVNLAGDFFIVGDIDSMLLAKFKGIRLEREALERALEGVDCGTVIMNLKKEQLINLLTD